MSDWEHSFPGKKLYTLCKHHQGRWNKVMATNYWFTMSIALRSALRQTHLHRIWAGTPCLSVVSEADLAICFGYRFWEKLYSGTLITSFHSIIHLSFLFSSRGNQVGVSHDVFLTVRRTRCELPTHVFRKSVTWLLTAEPGPSRSEHLFIFTVPADHD